MKTQATTVLLGVGAVAAMGLLPRGAHAQPGDGGSPLMGESSTSDGPPGGNSTLQTNSSSSSEANSTMGGGSDGGPAAGGGPPVQNLTEIVICPEDGSGAHYDEVLM